MAGIREKSKQRRRQLVLTAAEKLFREGGYSRATIEEIATVAEVSIGTIYSYFGSKGGIMRALMHPVIEDMQKKGEAILANPPPRPVDAIAALYVAYRFTNDWKHVNILKALDPRTRHSDEELAKLSDEFEDFIKLQVGQMFDQLKSTGSVPETVDTDDAAFLIYLLLVGHFESYLLDEGQSTYEEMQVDLHRRLRLIFMAWS